MKIIDAHIHFSSINSFKKTGDNYSKVDYSEDGLLKEFEKTNVVLGIAMGVTETNQQGFPSNDAQTPMGIDLNAPIPKNIVYCPGVNPYTLSQESLKILEKEVQKDNVVGIKIYLGYYPFYAYDDVYKPVYEIAAKYGLPVVFHTGDTYSERGLLKYSHPLTLDEVAVFNRDVSFVMAHLGDPWVLDGAEVVYKNANMYADLSGWVVGTKETIDAHLQTNFFDHIKHAITFCDHYDKLLFGTDWPLVPIQAYVDLIKRFVPEQYHEDVFYNNACKVFPKIKPIIGD
ncbi:TatD family hydrolase [Bacillus carboniphilus]|uniref:TatD family hydrolase n=1 Tax=Bacillus carboniphilus TaxID=86663 RepID=A0ABY9JX72_9BACI|nr:TatD family hydrolase [Bacillus carboniphilus]WLR43394.1 TatD family hydrolase [Bacillus carboniphilus]